MANQLTGDGADDGGSTVTILLNGAHVDCQLLDQLLHHLPGTSVVVAAQLTDLLGRRVNLFKELIGERGVQCQLQLMLPASARPELPVGV